MRGVMGITAGLCPGAPKDSRTSQKGNNSMARPLLPLPSVGTKIDITTSGCVVDEPVMLEITQGDQARYACAIKVNDKTSIKLPAGSFRFNFHFRKVDGPSTFTAAVLVPSTGTTFPKNPSVGTGTKPTGENGLVAFKVVV